MKMRGIFTKKRIIIICIMLAVVATGIVVFAVKAGKSKTAAGSKQQQNTTELKKMDLSTSVSATGTIESSKTVSVAASVKDIKIKNVKVQVGDKVKKGDTLVTFDVSDLNDALEEARETYEDTVSEQNKKVSKASSNVSEAKSDYTSNTKEKKAAVAKAKKALAEAKRKKQGVEQAQSAYEQAVSELKNSKKQDESTIENAEDNLDTAISERKKSIKEANKQLDEAKDALEKCKVTAPMTGIITAVNVEEGGTYSGDTMFKIVKSNSYNITTTVDEYGISDLKIGQKVVFLTEATGDDELEGEVTFIAPTTESSNSSAEGTNSGSSGGTSSGTTSGYEVKIKVKSKDKRLRLGLTAKCSIVKEEVKDVFAVPYDAIHEDSSGNSVIYAIVSDDKTNKSQEIQVTKGMESDYYVEISGEDLQEGMKVIIPSDETSKSSDDEDSDSDKNNGIFGNMGGGGMQGGGPQGGGPQGGGGHGM
ncbi:MAG: efflux RND transporter periplasmic adaptor subunit [Eubacterium sp.]|nr:efflux RND transporter periplasmic adaptor subunit [Eubacterium sp.]